MLTEPQSKPLLPPPESFYVFVVGHCEEWPENREEQGDTAIYREYLDFGVPSDQCYYLKDDECTRTNCQKSLETLLRKISGKQKDSSDPPRTLVFYYGGHGCAEGFSTLGGTWTHRQVVQTIDKLFPGDRVLFFLDCCAAGSLWRHCPTNQTKEYVLLATSQPYIATSTQGDEWIISNTWIQIMRLHCDSACSSSLGLEETISLLADRHVFELGDLFYAYRSSSTEIIETWAWMPAWNGRKEDVKKEAWSSWLKAAIESPTAESLYRMPDEARILSVYDCRVGDAIAYKHPGGCPISLPKLGSVIQSFEDEESSRVSVPPLWLNGTIVSIFEKDRGLEESETMVGCSNIWLRIRVWYPSLMDPWEVEVSHRSTRLINHFFVAQSWMLPRSFQETQVVLAQKYHQYLDCSLAANTAVRVALEDTVLEGAVLDWKDFHWKDLLRSCTGNSPATTKFDDFYWHELPVPIKAAAKALGYTKSRWNKDTGIPADTMSWEEFSRAQKDAATLLGYVPPKSVTSPESNGSESNNTHREACWKSVSRISTCSGPHVPVEWDNSHQSSFVPLKKISVRDDGNVHEHKNRDTMIIQKSHLTSKNEDGDKQTDFSQKQSLIQGLESTGKSIGNANHIFGTTELSAFWVEDDSWYEATPMNTVYDDTVNRRSNKNEELPLDLIATHFEYTLPGVYCPIEYEDGVRHLLPLSYVFRRGCYPQLLDGSSDSSSSDSSSDTESLSAGVVLTAT